MSHELRTPLNAVNGYTDLMEMGIGGTVTEAQREYLARIKKSGNFLLGLINDVLNFARIDAGTVSVKREPVRLESILEASHMLVEPQMKARNIAYRWVTTALDMRAVGYSEKIEQVILNLLTNALKFTDPGGAITLSWCPEMAGRKSASPTRDGEFPSPSFSRFLTRSCSWIEAHTRQSAGRWAGLAISRALARAMGGELTAESEVGKGSVFTLYLELSSRVKD